VNRIGKSGILLLILAAVIPVKAQKSAAPETADLNTKGASRNHIEPTAATTDPNYVIGPSDELNVDVWKEPNVSRSIPVRPDGKISLPLLNDVQAAGLTPAQLTSAITEKLANFMNSPQVTVIVTAVNSQRIYVLGEVGRAGAYPMLPQMTVLQALSSAGGFSAYANLKGIYVLRTENGKQVHFPFNYKEVIRGQKNEQNIVLKSGDTLVVP
jgi:polysaccharide export outer membrane protein